MASLRFGVGDRVLCNFGPKGWKLGRIIALHYREAHWPPGRTAPYQVLLEADRSLIYVPRDDAAYCRAASPEDLRMSLRADALAALPPGAQQPEGQRAAGAAQLRCGDTPHTASTASYRSGRCHGCGPCPRGWSAVELYSEHYRCADRNGLRITRRTVHLGTVRVGDRVAHAALPDLPTSGFLQCPTLVRLPPGVRFSDDGALTGEVRFDPHRDAAYPVTFVAVSTAAWDDPAVGLVRLEITMTVEGNTPSAGFDTRAFEHNQQRARTSASHALDTIGTVWEQWDRGQLDNQQTRARIWAELDRLRALLQRHPRLDGGRWWAWLGGYHMNVHKLLDNALFECELYLGHALTFDDPDVRRVAEANLAGCYQKRELEAARFLFIEGVERMLRGDWASAADTLQRAAAQKDGWGWAVNYGDIWMAEAAARLLHGVGLAAQGDDEGAQWIAEAERVLGLALARSSEARVFGPEGHPWAAELQDAVAALHALDGADATEWRAALEQRTLYWCGQVLAGAPPFPPPPRARRVDAATLVARMPGYNA